MRALRQAFVVVALLLVLGSTASPATARSVGQVIDDTVVTTEVKAKLTAEQLSNLTKIEVKTENSIVTLNGIVDTPERRVRAAQIASGVNGVRGIVNNIHVAGTTTPPAPAAGLPAAVANVDATGVVASVDGATGTVVLQDGRVLRLTNQTVVWQPTTIQSLRPGAHVYLREAAPVTVQPTVAIAQPEWRMSTVRSVDRAAGVLVLRDGSAVRVGPTTIVRRGNDRIALDQIVPGTEVVIRTLPPASSGIPEGQALPGALRTTEASEITVMWTPVGSR